MGNMGNAKRSHRRLYPSGQNLLCLRKDTAKDYTVNNLSIDLRPRHIDEVIGHDSIKAAIKKQIDSGLIPRAFMFSGPAGLGKTTLAHIVARMVQQEDDTDAPLDITELNAADTNGVDDIRELIATCAYRPFSGRYKVLILNESQMLTAAAQNVLLAPCEAEDSSSVFIFTTTDPSKIIQPLQDRCIHFKLRGMAEVQVIELIQRASDFLKVPYKDEFVVVAVNANIQSPRVLLQSYEKYVSGVPLKDCFTSAAHQPIFKDIALAVIRGDWNESRNLLGQIQTADTKPLRSIVSGFLRSALLKTEQGPKADALATCLVGMSQSSFEDGLSWGACCGLLYKTAKAISGAK
jgi:hypothetical protein